MTDHIYDPKAIRQAKNRIEKQKVTDLSDSSLRVAIYTRVSSEMQLDGYSLDFQKQACEEFAGRMGWKKENFTYYCDPAKSGRNDKRPEFQKMIRDAQSGRFDVLVVHKLDRFMRNWTLCTQYLKILIDNGIAIFFFGDNLDFSVDEIGGIKYTMFAWFADYYSQNLSKECKKGLDMVFESGRQSGWATWGYIKKEGRHSYIVDESRRAVIVEIFEKYATGDYSFADLARLLNERGYVRHDGNPFVSRAVSRIIHNPFYAGCVVHGEKIGNGIQEAIISRELFEKCQHVGDVRNEKMIRRKSNNLDDISKRFMLHKLLICKECGKRIALRSQKKYDSGKVYNYYSELNNTSFPYCKYKLWKTPSHIPEEQVTDILCKLQLPDEWLSSVLEEKSQEFSQDDKELESLERQAKSLKEKAISEDLSDEERDAITEQRKMVYAKIKDKKAQRKDPKEKIDMLQSLLRSFSTCFVEASMSEKAEICHLLFNGIIFDVENRKVTAFIPNEDFLLLFELIADQNHWKIEIQDDKKVFILL